MLGFQHIALIREHYKELASAILGQCSHQAYFRTNDSEMAKWCASQFGRLITYDENGLMKHDNPAATENDFTQDLRPATDATGFQCIIRSTPDVLPGGPRKIEIKPRKDLAAHDPRTIRPSEQGVCNWPKEPSLEPWDEAERAVLGLPSHATTRGGIKRTFDPLKGTFTDMGFYDDSNIDII